MLSNKTQVPVTLNADDVYFYVCLGFYLEMHNK